LKDVCQSICRQLRSSSGPNDAINAQLEHAEGSVIPTSTDLGNEQLDGMAAFELDPTRGNAAIDPADRRRRTRRRVGPTWHQPPLDRTQQIARPQISRSEQRPNCRSRARAATVPRRWLDRTSSASAEAAGKDEPSQAMVSTCVRFDSHGLDPLAPTDIDEPRVETSGTPKKRAIQALGQRATVCPFPRSWATAACRPHARSEWREGNQLRATITGRWKGATAPDDKLCTAPW